MWATEAEYWEDVVGMLPSAAAPFLPIWMMQKLIYEDGVKVGETAAKPRTYDPPPNYVLFADKMAELKKKGWKMPSAWNGKGPMPACMNMLARWPVATPEDGSNDAKSPAGAAWYPAMVMETHENSWIHEELGVKMVIP